MTMITPSYLGETIEYSSLHACRSTLEDPTGHYLGRPVDVQQYWDGSLLVSDDLVGAVYRIYYDGK